MTADLLGRIEAKSYPAAKDVRVGAERYTDQAWLEREKSSVFRRQPLLVAHSDELEQVGSCLTVDDLGLGAMVVRGTDGKVRAFVNSCRHRGTRLVDEASCKLSGFVCPYHRWSYGLDGRLRGLPHQHAFDSVKRGVDQLVELPVAERHGMVWLLADRCAELDLDTHLGPISDEFEALGLANHVLHRHVVCERAANWKLIIDAFLEAYHIKTLHGATLARFFVDSRALVNQVGPHLRAVTARRAILKAREVPESQWPIRELVTPSYLLFPNTIVIVHPDYVSLITVMPVASDRLRWIHRMLIPEPANSAAQHAHWDKTFRLIEETVFQQEDLMVAELMQRGLETGADPTVVFGQLEQGCALFHQTLDAALRSTPA